MVERSDQIKRRNAHQGRDPCELSRVINQEVEDRLCSMYPIRVNAFHANAMCIPCPVPNAYAYGYGYNTCSDVLYNVYVFPCTASPVVQKRDPALRRAVYCRYPSLVGFHGIRISET